MTGRRTLLGGGLALAAGGGAWLAGGAVRARAEPPAGTPLRIGYLPITDAAPLLLAHQRGLYGQAGVAVATPVRFRSWSSLAEALLVGEVDVIHLLMPMALALRFDRGADASVVAWNHVNGSALTVRPDIERTEQLAGTSVAIPAWWSVHNVILQKLLRGAGLTPVIREEPSAAQGTVQLLPMAPSDMLPGLQNGVIGGYVVADPFNAAAELQQVGRIHRFLGDVWHRHACCVTVMRGPVLRRRPAEAAAFMDALVTAQAFARGHRAEVAPALASGYLPQKPAAIARAFDYDAAAHSGALHHPGWQGERLDFLPFPYPSYTRELVTGMRETLVDTSTGFLDRLDPATSHEGLVDDSLVLSSIAGLGGMGAFGQDGLTRTEQISA